MPTPPAVFIYSKDYEENFYPPECPFNTSRAGKARKILFSMGLLVGDDVTETAPIAAEPQEVLNFHTPAYLEALKLAEEGNITEASLHMGLPGPDTPVFPGLYKYAMLAAGSTIMGARLILERQARVVFNPFGGLHHAHTERAAGFCYINDVVLGCMKLAAADRKVLFLDLDAHHCDGVQEAFWQRRDVMTISLHEGPETLFPGTGFEHEIGEGEGLGYTVNCPLPPGIYDEEYTKVFRTVALPLIHAYNPDVIVLELGMDGLAGDPLTHMNLTNNAYADVLELVHAFGKPILAVGGGGYNAANTARGWALMWSILSGAGSDAEMMFGLGGVMLESTEWRAGLRDRARVVLADERKQVGFAVEQMVDRVRRCVFPLHGK